MERVLIIDDNVMVHELLTEYLSQESFQVEAARDGESGLAKAFSSEYELILLETVLPGMDGFSVLRSLRARLTTPIIVLTSRSDVVDKVVGLEIGADDYLAKPFDLRELLARIHAVLRRTRQTVIPITTSEKIRVGDVEMDVGAHLVTCSGKQPDLTSAEFCLLETLLRNAGHLVSREDLTRVVLGRSLYPYDRSIDVHIARLRKKLGPDPLQRTSRIKTIRGLGYQYVFTRPVFELYASGGAAGR